MFQIDLSWLQISPWLIALVVISIVAFLALVLIWGIRAHRQRVFAGREELIGRTGEVQIALEPRGVVYIDGERWTAISEGGQVEPGEEVIITRVEGLRLYVTKKS